MSFRAIERCEGPFDVKEDTYDSNLYYVGVAKGAPYAYCHVQTFEEFAYVHLKVIRFSHETLRTMLGDFTMLKDLLARCGVKCLVGYRKAEEAPDLWFKFIRLAGFSKAEAVKVGDIFYQRVYLKLEV